MQGGSCPVFYIFLSLGDGSVAKKFLCWLQWIFLFEPQILRVLQDHCQGGVKTFPKQDRKHWNKLLEATAFILLSVFKAMFVVGVKTQKPMNLIYLKLFSYFTWNTGTYP